VSDTLVFIPAWNEEDNLPGVLDALHAELPEADVVVIDDGSTDDTAPVARAHGAEVESLGANLGLRFGIAAGYRYALEHGYAYCVGERFELLLRLSRESELRQARARVSPRPG